MATVHALAGETAFADRRGLALGFGFTTNQFDHAIAGICNIIASKASWG